MRQRAFVSRAAFTSAVLILAISCFVWFDSKTTQLISGIGSTVLAVIFYILSPTGESLPDFIRKTLGRFANQAGTVLVLIITALGWGGFALVRLGQPARYTVVVLTQDAAPANGATITVLAGKEAWTAITNASGRAELPAIPFSMFRRDLLVEVRAWWGDVSRAQRVKIRHTHGQITFYLPQSAVDFRLSYLALAYHDLDLLARGRIKPLLPAQRSVAVVETPLMQWFRSLVFHNRLPALPEDSVTDRLLYYHDGGEYDGEAELGLRQGAFVGSALSGVQRDDAPGDYIRSAVSPPSHWLLGLRNQGKSPDDIVLWRPLPRDSLLEVIGTPEVTRFLNGVVPPEEYPDDYAFEVLYCPCFDNGCGTIGLMDAVVYRVPVMLAVLVENVSNRALRLTDASIRSNRATSLRSFSSDSVDLHHARAQTTRVFPSELLAPGESLLVPLAMSLEFAPVHLASAGESWSGLVESFTDKEFARGSPIRYLQWYDQEEIVISRDVVARLQRTSDRFPTAVPGRMAREEGYVFNDYVVGPSMHLDALTINGTSYTVRDPADSYRTLIPDAQWGWESRGACCPFLYTQDVRSDSLRNEGTILSRRSGSRKAGWDLRAIGQFNGRLVIREEEAEISYVDALRVIEVAADGTVQRIFPKDGKLRRPDGQRRVLRPGEELTIEFDGRFPRAGATYWVQAHGFYKPLPIDVVEYGDARASGRRSP